MGRRLQLSSTRVWFAAGGLIASMSIAPACGQESNIPDGFVLVKDIVPSIVLDMRYYHGHNFIGRQIEGYLAPNSYLTRPAAEALKNVQDELMELGLSLKIYDSYRPQRAVNEFIEWAEDLDDTAAKAEFYPDLSKTVLFDEGYISARSGHTRGSTLDLTIVPYPPPDEPDWSAKSQQSCKLPADQRFARKLLSRHRVVPRYCETRGHVRQVQRDLATGFEVDGVDFTGLRKTVALSRTAAQQRVVRLHPPEREFFQ